MRRVGLAALVTAATLLVGCSNEPRATPAPNETAPSAVAPASTPSEPDSAEPSEPGVPQVAFGKAVNIEAPDGGTIRVTVDRPKVSYQQKTAWVAVKSLTGRVEVDFWEVMVQGSDGTIESLGSFSSDVTSINKGQQVKTEFYFPESFLKDKKLKVYVAESSDNSTPIAIWS